MPVIIGLIAVSGLAFIGWALSQQTADGPGGPPPSPSACSPGDILSTQSTTQATIGDPVKTVAYIGCAQPQPPAPAGPTPKRHTMNSLAACMWLKTLILAAQKTGLFKQDVVIGAIANDDRFALDTAKGVIKVVGGASAAAVAIGVGSIAAVASLATVVSNAASFIVLVAALGSEEDRRINQARAVGAWLRWYVHNAGMPPTAILHAQAALLPDPAWAIIDGMGTFDRTREWGPGQLAHLVRLYARLVSDGWITDSTPLLDPTRYRGAVQSGIVSAVWSGQTGKLTPSRLAEWTRYVLHPYWLLVEPLDPLSDHYAAYKRALALSPDPFSFDLASFLRGSKHPRFRVETYRGTHTTFPTATSWRIGHDPGSNAWPSPGLGFVPNSGSVTIARRDWEVVFTINSNNGWLST